VLAVVPSAEDGQARLAVSDDGVGFDPAIAAPRGHHGLGNMRDRATALGGVLEVESDRSGTTIIVRVPMSG